MDHLLHAAVVLWRETGARDELRLIGGLAVRLHVGAIGRVTGDVDVVALTVGVRGQLLHYLEAAGWAVGQSGGWWRALRPGEPRLVLDIAQHPVVNPSTFEVVTLRAPPVVQTFEGIEISVAGINDLAAMKLVAGRDQDLVDLLLLASAGASPGAIVETAELDDIERYMSAGANLARHALQNGVIRDLVQQTLARDPSQEELSRLEEFLEALRRSGL